MRRRESGSEGAEGVRGKGKEDKEGKRESDRGAGERR